MSGDMSIKLPVQHWDVIMQLLQGAPYVRAKPIVEEIERQARLYDATRTQAHTEQAKELARLRSEQAEHERKLRHLAEDLRRKDEELRQQARDIERLRRRRQRKEEELRGSPRILKDSPVVVS